MKYTLKNDTRLTFPGEMGAVDLPRSRYFQVSNEAPAVKGGFATERSEAPLTAEGARLLDSLSVPGMLPAPLTILHINPMDRFLMAR